MVHAFYRVPAWLLVVLSLTIWGACAQKSPEERVAEARTKYLIEPTGFLVQELQPPAQEAEAAGEAEAEEPAAEAEGAGEAEAVEEAAAAGPRTVKVMFDLVVGFDGREALPGITVEVVHKDAFDKEKGRNLQWIETAGAGGGQTLQVSFEREIQSYEDGDKFEIEFLPYVEPAKRGDYREFTEAGG